VIRSSSLIVAIYGFGDALGSGFGSSIMTSSGVSYRYGLWGSDLDDASSNFQELFNLTEAAAEHVATLAFLQLEHLVDTVAAEAMAGGMHGEEFFLFTDNAVAEAAFFKGTSSNIGPFNLVLQLKQLELEYGFILHVLHVSGRRMIQQGTDGLSRGDTTSGVLRGSSMLEFVPLHLSASQRSSALLGWCATWIPSRSEMLAL
jgi:hypothetical protein